MLHKAQLEALNRRRGAVLLHRRIELPAYLDPEWQANTFAASLLMPAPAVVAILEATKGSMWTPESMIAQHLKVSLAAARLRLKTLGL
jgi:Zn-dependent peptidase ImmA (M78 family)